MKYFLLLLPLLFLACNSNDGECKSMPNDYFCVSRSDDVTNRLKINIITNELNPRVPIEIYAGSSVETGALVVRDTVSRSTVYELSEGNYAAYALYTVVHEGKISKLIKLNDVRISAKKEEFCEEDCYEPDYEEIDLKLMSQYQ